MNDKMKNLSVQEYDAPECTVTEIKVENAMCASLGNASNDEMVYDLSWGVDPLA